MKAAIKIVLVLLAVLVAGGLAVCGIDRVRLAAAQMQCANNLRQIGVGMHNYCSAREHFPPGIVPNPDLPPEKRLGWTTEIASYLEATSFAFDEKKGWEAKENCPPQIRVKTEPGEGRGVKRRQALPEFRYFLCPSNPERNGPELPGPTHYAGIAGLGEDAATLPLAAPRAGVFGYNRTLTEKDITDGLSTTLMIAEVLDGGPWTAGGTATVRGLVPQGRPYLGHGGQFASYHGPANFAFADGSVRTLTRSVSPEVFEALSTIAGGEVVDLRD